VYPTLCRRLSYNRHISNFLQRERVGCEYSVSSIGGKSLRAYVEQGIGDLICRVMMGKQHGKEALLESGWHAAESGQRIMRCWIGGFPKYDEQRWITIPTLPFPAPISSPWHLALQSRSAPASAPPSTSHRPLRSASASPNNHLRNYEDKHRERR
jgi:hypothetical protein